MSMQPPRFFLLHLLEKETRNGELGEGQGNSVVSQVLRPSTFPLMVLLHLTAERVSQSRNEVGDCMHPRRLLLRRVTMLFPTLNCKKVSLNPHAWLLRTDFRRLGTLVKSRRSENSELKKWKENASLHQICHTTHMHTHSPKNTYRFASTEYYF